MIDEIHILKHRKGCNFGRCPGKKSGWLLCVISDHYELVVELRKDGSDSFPELLVSPGRRSPILLIQSIGDFQSDICHIEKVLLYLRTEIPLVSKHHAIVIFPPHIVEVMEVMNVGGSHVIRMYDTAYSADCVEFIAVIVDALRCAVPPLRSAFIITFAHGAAFCAGILTHFDGFGVNAENVLIAIHRHGYVFADFLTEHGCELAALIILASGYQVGQALSFFRMKASEKVIFTIETKRLGRGRECHDLKVGELGYNATMWAISVLVYTISCEFLVDFKNLSELYDEVVHKRNDSNQWFGHH